MKKTVKWVLKLELSSETEGAMEAIGEIDSQLANEILHGFTGYCVNAPLDDKESVRIEVVESKGQVLKK